MFNICFTLILAIKLYAIVLEMDAWNYLHILTFRGILEIALPEYDGKDTSLFQQIQISGRPTSNHYSYRDMLMFFSRHTSAYCNYAFS